MRTEPCNQCGAVDYYVKGQFFYCRPCHTEAQKRYMRNKAQGETKKTSNPPPSRTLNSLLEDRNVAVKQYCKHGHPLFGDNVLITSQRKGKHLRKLCRTCARNLKRVKYGLAVEPAPTKLSDLLDTD